MTHKHFFSVKLAVCFFRNYLEKGKPGPLKEGSQKLISSISDSLERLVKVMTNNSGFT